MARDPASSGPFSSLERESRDVHVSVTGEWRRLRKLTQCPPQTRGGQQCLSRYWLAALVLLGSGLCWQWAFPTFNLRAQSASGQQSIQASKQTLHRSVPPKAVSPCCRNTASGEGRGDGIRLGYAARPYLGNDRRERGCARISPRCRCPAGSLASLRCSSCHCTTLDQSDRRRTGTPAKREVRLGPPVTRRFHRGSEMGAPGISMARKMTFLS
jgi:hypothetical protein